MRLIQILAILVASVEVSTFMFKRFFKKKWLPKEEEIRKHRILKFFKPIMEHKAYWRFNESSISRAVLIGVFISFMPIPFQMIVVVLIGLFIRANLILSIALVWISNPITMPPMMYGCYLLGKWLLEMHSNGLNTEVTISNVLSQPGLIIQPLLVGCFVAGIVCAIVAYIGFRIVAIFYRRHQVHKAMKLNNHNHSSHDKDD